jgi:hypothetical protein
VRARVRTVRAALAGIGVAVMVRSGAASGGDPEARQGAWDDSVRLEQSGDVAGARALLVRAWGPSPDSYEVTVRIAWLGLKAHDNEQAVAAYRRARALPGAGPEATEGLVSSLVALADQRAAEGRTGEAAALRDEARRIDPSVPVPKERPFRPEIWAGYVGKSTLGQISQGAVAFVHVPWRFYEDFRLRAAYRHISLASNAQAAGSTAGRGRRAATSYWHQNEVYGALGWGRGAIDFEAIGLALAPSDDSTALGVGGSARFGQRYGAILEASSIRRADWHNEQIVPTLFYWPTRSLGLAAGTRTTWDGAFRSTSARAVLTFSSAKVLAQISGHYGKERWAAALAVPVVVNLDEDLLFGASAVALVSVSASVGIGLSASAERTSLDGFGGTYGSVALGLRWAPDY